MLILNSTPKITPKYWFLGLFDIYEAHFLWFYKKNSYTRVHHFACNIFLKFALKISKFSKNLYLGVILGAEFKKSIHFYIRWSLTLKHGEIMPKLAHFCLFWAILPLIFHVSGLRITGGKNGCFFWILRPKLPLNTGF